MNLEQPPVPKPEEKEKTQKSRHEQFIQKSESMIEKVLNEIEGQSTEKQVEILKTRYKDLWNENLNTEPGSENEAITYYALKGIGAELYDRNPTTMVGLAHELSHEQDLAHV